MFLTSDVQALSTYLTPTFSLGLVKTLCTYVNDRFLQPIAYKVISITSLVLMSVVGRAAH